MLVPLSWLAERVDLRGSVDELCEKLTFAGLETEIASDERPAWDGVVTALLRAVEPHPAADKLTVTTPWDGTVERTVVCGATNHKAGDVVALATPGTSLPNGLKIKKSKLRGVPSEGMLCSESELGLSDESAGIIVLPPDTPIGVPLSEVLASGEVILEVAPTANRGDCLSVAGLARELSAVTGWPMHGRRADPEDAGDQAGATITQGVTAPGVRSGRVGSGGQAVDVRIEAPDGCPRYACAVMTGVRVAPSPDWMQRRLEAMGVRAINNVVDCTNYVMLELGNPLHAFDRRFVRGGRIGIRRAAEGEPCRTLDGVDHRLLASDLVITDGEGVVALAGVMGGENSEVREDTATLVLESAHFDPMTVRRTAHRLKMSTESSYRFARGVDPELPRTALLRLIELLERTAGARLDGGVLDLYPEPASRPAIELRPDRIRGLLGLEMSRSRAVELLRRAGLSPRALGPEDEDPLEVEPPSYRFDIEREADLLEEIARLAGFEEMPSAVPTGSLRAVPRIPAGPDLRALRAEMVRLGLSEAIHYSFIDPEWLVALGVPEDHPFRARAVPIGNPLSEVGGLLRPTLLPSLLRATARNRAMGAADIRLFELRNTFLAREEGYAQLLAGDGRKPLDRSPVLEARTISGVLVGRRAPPGWAQSAETVDFHDVKGIAEAAAAALGAKGFAWTTEDLPPYLDPAEGARLVTRGRPRQLGVVGRVAVPVLRAFDLDVVAYVFELDVDALAPKKAPAIAFRPFSRFPGVERDLAMVVPDGIPAEEVVSAAERAAAKAGADFQDLAVFDVYRGKGIPDGHRSIALRLRFRALDRTLSDVAVDKAMGRVTEAVTRLDGVTLRA